MPSQNFDTETGPRQVHAPLRILILLVLFIWGIRGPIRTSAACDSVVEQRFQGMLRIKIVCAISAELCYDE